MHQVSQCKEYISQHKMYLQIHQNIHKCEFFYIRPTKMGLVFEKILSICRAYIILATIPYQSLYFRLMHTNIYICICIYIYICTHETHINRIALGGAKQIDCCRRAIAEANFIQHLDE